MINRTDICVHISTLTFTKKKKKKIISRGNNSNGQLGIGSYAPVGNEGGEMTVLGYLGFSDGFLATDVSS